ncbi:MAG: hypothetical protein HY321_09240 [Armatimonadetes bacterium]|nr:hypothetical protein [Armatimonadota bacterium]
MLNPLIAAVREFASEMAREGHACHVVSGAEPEEAQPLEPARFQAGVRHVEGAEVRARHTGFRAPRHAGSSGFRYFLDGIQFSRLILIINNAPLVYHISAAAILRRDPATGELHPWRRSPVCECVLTARDHLPGAARLAERLAPFGQALEEVDEEGKTSANALLLRDRARSKSQSLRRKLEVDLIAEWTAAAPEGWLMVDGPLIPLPGLTLAPRIVGVVKSFGAQYFTGAEQMRILMLPECQRTTAFQVPRHSSRSATMEPGEGRRAYSWYVRIRDHRGREPDFGLLRLETPPGIPLPEGADEVSRWLIAERAPLSSADPRWDNLLYPIHLCERYLKSLVPQRDQVPLQLRRALLEIAGTTDHTRAGPAPG